MVITSDDEKVIKGAKDVFVASLGALSKASTEVSNAAIDYFNAIESVPDSEQFTAALASSLEALAKFTTGVAKFGNFEDSEDDDGKKKKRKRGKPSDPNAPKKPVTMYFAYAIELRKQIKEERDKEGLEPLSNIEMTQELSKRWASLNDEDKVPWKKAYDEQWLKYAAEKEEYDKSKNGQGEKAGETVESDGEFIDAAEFDAVKLIPTEIAKEVSIKEQDDDEVKHSSKKSKKSKSRKSLTSGEISDSGSASKKEKKKSKKKKRKSHVTSD